MTEADSQNLAVLNPEQALQELIAGNRRYALGAGIHPHQTLHRRDEIASAQHPFAAVVSCSDSRVPPEIIFDCGLGDLFVVRSAGHVLDDALLASVQYAVEHLGVGLILVLGLGDCGAVKAALEGFKAADPLSALLGKIQPAVAAASGRAGDQLDNAVIQNIQLTLARLKEMAWAKERLILGAQYSLKSGLVTLNPNS
jgi:carbonic anhydrase